MIDQLGKKVRLPTASPAVLPTARPWLISGSLARRLHLVLAHGAGAGMESPVLNRLAGLMDANGVTVHRFEFPYMAARRAGQSRRPAPRAETLIGDYHAAVAEVRARIGPGVALFAGGKSMGGRIACLAATANEDIAGVVVLGFPLTPPRRPMSTRASAIEGLTQPSLIVQGTRDAFGGPLAFSALQIPARVTVHWIDGGDHDLKTRKSSGVTHDETLSAVAQRIASFCADVGGD